MNIEHERNIQTEELAEAELALVTGGVGGDANALSANTNSISQGNVRVGGGGGQVYIPFVGYVTPK